MLWGSSIPAANVAVSPHRYWSEPGLKGLVKLALGAVGSALLGNKGTATSDTSDTHPTFIWVFFFKRHCYTCVRISAARGIYKTNRLKHQRFFEPNAITETRFTDHCPSTHHHHHHRRCRCRHHHHLLLIPPYTHTLRHHHHQWFQAHHCKVRLSFLPAGGVASAAAWWPSLRQRSVNHASYHRRPFSKWCHKS